jgi:hypothetical protein
MKSIVFSKNVRKDTKKEGQHNTWSYTIEAKGHSSCKQIFIVQRSLFYGGSTGHCRYPPATGIYNFPAQCRVKPG